MTRVFPTISVALAVFFLIGHPLSLYSKKRIEKEKAQTQENRIDKADETLDAVKTGNDDGETAGEAVAKDATEGEEGNAGYRLYQTVKGGGMIMIPIIILAFISLTVIIERLIFYTKNGVWDRERLISHLEALARGSGAAYREDMEDHLRSGFQVYINGLERGLGILAGIGNLAPIIGFLGTVWGLIKAFASIVAATTVTAKVVAAGIQIALVTTAGGLAVAAPTLVFYYLFTTLIQNRFSAADETINKMCEHMPRMTDQIERGDPTRHGNVKAGKKVKSKR